MSFAYKHNKLIILMCFTHTLSLSTYTALPLDLSDRPNMCSAANWAKNEIVIGSSDHALYIIDAVKVGLNLCKVNAASYLLMLCLPNNS